MECFTEMGSRRERAEEQISTLSTDYDCEDSIFSPENHCVKIDEELTDIELDQSALKQFDQSCVESTTSLKMKKKKEKKKKTFLFAPFNHRKNPDPEYISLESEQSALDQETLTKTFQTRYQLIMENAARRKEKKDKDRMKFSPSSSYCNNEEILKSAEFLHNLTTDPEFPSKELVDKISSNLDTIKTLADTYIQRNKNCAEVENKLEDPLSCMYGLMEFTPLSHNLNSENILQTTHLFHNLHITPMSSNEHQPNKISENNEENMNRHGEAFQLGKMTFIEETKTTEHKEVLKNQQENIKIDHLFCSKHKISDSSMKDDLIIDCLEL